LVILCLTAPRAISFLSKVFSLFSFFSPFPRWCLTVVEHSELESWRASPNQARLIVPLNRRSTAKNLACFLQLVHTPAYWSPRSISLKHSSRKGVAPLNLIIIIFHNYIIIYMNKTYILKIYKHLHISPYISF